jgi:hypothetical protein
MLVWIVGGIISLCLLVMVYVKVRIQVLSRRPKKIISEIFKDTKIQKPYVKYGYHYAWPTFTVIFDTLDSFECAERLGLLKKIEIEIRNFYAPKFGSEFDFSRAISFLYLKNNSNEFSESS